MEAVRCFSRSRGGDQRPYSADRGVKVFGGCAPKSCSEQCCLHPLQVARCFCVCFPVWSSLSSRMKTGVQRSDGSPGWLLRGTQPELLLQGTIGSARPSWALAANCRLWADCHAHSPSCLPCIKDACKPFTLHLSDRDFSPPGALWAGCMTRWPVKSGRSDSGPAPGRVSCISISFVLYDVLGVPPQ